MSDYGNVSRKLEAAFFLEEDRKLIEKLKLQKQHEERKAKLTRLFGIHDEDLLHKLLELNIHDETLAALMLIPLLEVAWADGDIQPKEQEAILAMAEKSGLQKGSAEYEMLDRWLMRKPDAVLLKVWTHYVQALSKDLSEPEKKHLMDDVFGRARTVATAAGGFLGLCGKVSDAEKAMLRKLEAAFE